MEWQTQAREEQLKRTLREEYKYPAGRKRRRRTVEHTGVEVSWHIGWERTDSKETTITA